MRILLDENFPADFAAMLVGHDVSNVHSHAWAGRKNGELLRRAPAPIALLTSRHTFRPFFWRPPKSAQVGCDCGCVAPRLDRSSIKGALKLRSFCR
jgi:hypothetical protein